MQQEGSASSEPSCFASRAAPHSRPTASTLHLLPGSRATRRNPWHVRLRHLLTQPESLRSKLMRSSKAARPSRSTSAHPTSTLPDTSPALARSHSVSSARRWRHFPATRRSSSIEPDRGSTPAPVRRKLSTDVGLTAEPWLADSMPGKPKGTRSHLVFDRLPVLQYTESDLGDQEGRRPCPIEFSSRSIRID